METPPPEESQVTSTGPQYRREMAGTTLGLIVFLAGIALLVFVFALALRVFRDPSVLTAIATTPPAGAPGSPGMVGMLVAVGVKILALFIMVLAGSLIAGKGIHLYLSSK